MKTVAFFIQTDNIELLKPFKKSVKLLKHSGSPYWSEGELSFEPYKAKPSDTNLFKYKTKDASGSCVVVKFDNIDAQTQFILTNGLAMGSLNLNRFYYTTHRYLEFKNGDELVKELNTLKNFHKDFSYLTFKIETEENKLEPFSRH